MSLRRGYVPLLALTWTMETPAETPDPRGGNPPTEQVTPSVPGECVLNTKTELGGCLTSGNSVRVVQEVHREHYVKKPSLTKPVGRVKPPIPPNRKPTKGKAQYKKILDYFKQSKSSRMFNPTVPGLGECQDNSVQHLSEMASSTTTPSTPNNQHPTTPGVSNKEVVGVTATTAPTPGCVEKDEDDELFVEDDEWDQMASSMTTYSVVVEGGCPSLEMMRKTDEQKASVQLRDDDEDDDDEWQSIAGTMRIYKVDEDELCALLRAGCVSQADMWTVYRDVAVEDDDELISMMSECVVQWCSSQQWQKCNQKWQKTGP